MWGAIAAAGANILGNVIGTKMTNDKNQEIADAQMDFQKYMSNTSHQRAVKDLRKAGLNPILAANSGASTPGGAGYAAERPDIEIDPMLAQNVKQSKATTDNIVKDTGLKAANTKSAEKSLEIADEQKKLIHAQTAKESEQAAQTRQQLHLLNKYGDAQQMMGLINSGTGSIGNLLGTGNLFKNMFGKPKIFEEKIEHYNSQGEHKGTTFKTKGNRK